MTLGPAFASALADLVLAVHVSIAASVVIGLVLVIVGNLADWRWVNHLGFRAAHLAAIAVVAFEAWLGIACPLTTLEMGLRSQAGGVTYGGGFVEHWLQRLLYFDAPAWVFTLGYTVFGLAVLATWWVFPPAWTHSVGPSNVPMHAGGEHPGPEKA